jgi:hypothetical protein
MEPGQAEGGILGPVSEQRDVRLIAVLYRDCHTCHAMDVSYDVKRVKSCCKREDLDFSGLHGTS